MYKLGQHFFIYHYWYTSNFEATYKKSPFIKVAIFFWFSFSIKLSWLQRRSNKINTILCDIYYLQNCHDITFEKIASHTKYKKPNVSSHLHIFWQNFDNANHSFLHFFLLLEEIDFQVNAALGNEWFPSACIGRDDKNLGVNFEREEAWVKMPRINAFSRNVKTP